MCAGRDRSATDRSAEYPERSGLVLASARRVKDSGAAVRQQDRCDMSVVIHEVQTRSISLPRSLLARLAVAGMATAVVGLGLAVLGYLVFATGLVAAPAPRNPFVTGSSAGFAMATSGIGG